MSKYADWADDNIAVTTLLLDPQNPRLSALGHEATQREIVAELVKHEALYELAKDISDLGFFPTETLVCVRDGDALVTLEGNRRLASLKLLLSPELAPPDAATKFKTLSRKAAGIGITTVVNVTVAPSRSAAAPLIMNRHTQTGIRRWEPIQQAKYINSLRSTGLTIDQISAATGSSRAQLIENLRTHCMYEIAGNLDLDEEAASVVSDARKFNVSALERVIGSTKMRQFLRISFDDEGSVIGSSHPSDFKKAFKKIISDISSGTVDTRRLNNDKGITEYIKDLEPVRPKRPGSFTSNSLLGVKGPPAKANQQGDKPKTKTERTSACLVPKTLKCHLQMPRIRGILTELQRLKIVGFENATAVLLRIFLEMSISHYLESTGKMKVLVSRLDKGGTKPPGWTPTFRQMLGDILQNDPAVISAIPRQALKALNRAVSDDDHPLSLDGMDQFVHNPYVAPTDRQLRQFWNAFEKLAAFLMENHTATPPPSPKK